MIWAIVFLALALVGAILWIALRKPTPLGPDIAGEKKIAADFDAKKAAEHARIEKLDERELADDLAHRLRGK